MKKIIFVLFAAILFIGCAPMKDLASPEMRTFEKIIEIPGKSKNELYIDANIWLVENFNSAESVIQFQDKEAGKIAGKYIQEFLKTEDRSINSIAIVVTYYNVKQTIIIDTQEGRAKIKINDPYIKRGPTTQYIPLLDKKDINTARIKWKELAKDFESALIKSTNW